MSIEHFNQTTQDVEEELLDAVSRYLHYRVELGRPAVVHVWALVDDFNEHSDRSDISSSDMRRVFTVLRSRGHMHLEWSEAGLLCYRLVDAKMS